MKDLNKRIGFMQGRLSPQVNGMIQAFPHRTWKEEFKLAKSIGIELMEWTIDQDKIDKNPILNIKGREEIFRLKNQFNVEIISLTGDCFMQKPFWKSKSKEKQKLYSQFIKVCKACEKLKIELIIIPLVDNGAIENTRQEDEIIGFFNDNSQLLKELKIKIAFESDFEAKKLYRFVSKFNSSDFGINYDTGNSAALGYDPILELNTYGDLILNVHIKDRILGGTTVPLSTGNTNFESIFMKLNNINYCGNYILQTARTEDRKHTELIKEYMQFTKEGITRKKNIF